METTMQTATAWMSSAGYCPSLDIRRIRPTALAPNFAAQGTALSVAGRPGHSGSATDLPGSVPRSAPV